MALLVLAGSLVGCSLLVDTSDLAREGPTDGGAATDGPLMGASDAGPGSGADGATDGSATTTEAGADACAPASVMPLDLVWTLRGDAVAESDGVTLTPSAPETRHGALWRSEVVLFDAFEMTAEIAVGDPDLDGVIADGMTFAWIAGEAIPALGETGSALGLASAGLKGYAVAIDSFTSGDPARFLAVADASRLDADDAWYLTKGPDLGTRVLGSHRLRVRLAAGGVVSVWIDGLLAIDQFAIPGYVPYRGHWGFTGGTGGITSVQRVIRASFVPTTCPP